MGFFSGRIASFSAPAKPEPKTLGGEVIRPSVDHTPFMGVAGEALLSAYNECGALVEAGKGARVSVKWPQEVLDARGKLRTGKADNDLLRALSIDLVADLHGEAEYVSGGLDVCFDSSAAEGAMLYVQPRRGAMDVGPIVLGRGTVSLIERTANAVGMSPSRGVARSPETTLVRLLTEYNIVEKEVGETPVLANDDAQASVDADGQDME